MRSTRPISQPLSRQPVSGQTGSSQPNASARPTAPGDDTPANAVARAVAGTPAPVVRRIDHLIIRVDDRHYDALYSLFADTLRLPTPWPPTEHPTMRSGGIFAGNVDFEILYVPSDHLADQAELYGSVFEALDENATGLSERGFVYLPTAYTQKEPGKPRKHLWTNFFLESFWPGNHWQKLLFGIKKFVPDGWWIQSSSSSDANPKTVQWIFNQVYRKGIVFLVTYDKTWRDIDAERRISRAQLEMRGGGVLGLIRVKEVAVGTTQLTDTSALWRKLLRPATEETGLCWQVGDGPALRVITAERDGLHHMVWEVASLAEAQAALAELDLLGAVMPDEITLDPSKCFGLDIRLVEAPGGFWVG